MDRRGRAGAESYLSQYGRGIKLPKLVGFARCAEINGAMDFANRMWEEAYQLSTGQTASFNTAHNQSAAEIRPPAIRKTFSYRPQTLTVISMERALDLLATGEWCFQKKHDGERTVAENKDKVVTTGNKHGLVTARSLPLPIQEDLAAGPDVVIDSEFMKKDVTLVLFDILSHLGVDLRQLAYSRRLKKLEGLYAQGFWGSAIQIVETFIFKSRAEAKAKIDELDAAGAEGFVIKRLSAIYSEGDGHEDQYKVQFRATNAFIVGKRNGAKNSVEIFALKNGEKVSVGNVTINSLSELAEAKEGRISEVQYLYCYPDTNNLAQATWKGVRDDAEAEDCDLSKLRFKTA